MRTISKRWRPKNHIVVIDRFREGDSWKIRKSAFSEKSDLFSTNDGQFRNRVYGYKPSKAYENALPNRLLGLVSSLRIARLEIAGHPHGNLPMDTKLPEYVQ